MAAKGIKDCVVYDGWGFRVTVAFATPFRADLTLS
jgi:hypothetical protein